MNGLTSAYGRLSRNVRGALWMLASAVSFTVMTTLIKFLGDDYPAALQTFYRQAAGFVVLLPLIVRDPVGAFRTTRPGILIFRSGAGTVGTILAFYAYSALPLADANALSFTRTLWLVPLAAMVLKEHVGPRRITATLVGFAGVLFMVQPSATADAAGPVAAALISSLLFAFTITGMKVLTRDHTMTSLMVWAAGLGFVLSIPPALFVWRWPSWPDLGLLTAMGVIGTLTQACYIKGMTEGDAVAMAPIDYTRLIFAMIFGYILFSELPNVWTLVGASIVVGSTVYITWREHQLERRSQQLSAEKDPVSRG